MKKLSVFLRSAYNYDADEVSQETGLSCSEPTLAQQSFKDECDINTILERFAVTGELPNNVRMPQYGDFSGIFDYQTALNAVMAADDSFMQLPASVRARFDNDPALFVEFCGDESNREEAIKLGLVPPQVDNSPAPSDAEGGGAQ